MYSTLEDGEAKERHQEDTKNPSAWDYEDLPSNLLGAFFYEKYIKSGKYGSFSKALSQFLNDIRVVENPETSAPNYHLLPENQSSNGIGPENRTYTPVNITQTHNSWVDWEIINMLYKYQNRLIVRPEVEPIIRPGEATPTK